MKSRASWTVAAQCSCGDRFYGSGEDIHHLIDKYEAFFLHHVGENHVPVKPEKTLEDALHSILKNGATVHDDLNGFYWACNYCGAETKSFEVEPDHLSSKINWDDPEYEHDGDCPYLLAEEALEWIK